MVIKKKGRYNYYTDTYKKPYMERQQRIKIPPIDKRPVRFQVRSLIQKSFLRPEDDIMTIHSRGPYRPWVGIDALEARAISHDQIRGTLPERIIYKTLVEQYHLVEGIDFNFQSSLQGGRIDTGGIVADFIFPYLKMVINPLGPTHDEFIRIRKDEEQIAQLRSLGYETYMIPEDDVYDEGKFNLFMRKIFTTYHGGGQNMVQVGSPSDFEIDHVMNKLFGLELQIKYL